MYLQFRKGTYNSCDGKIPHIKPFLGSRKRTALHTFFFFFAFALVFHLEFLPVKNSTLVPFVDLIFSPFHLFHGLACL